MTIDPRCYIEIPADKLREAVKLAYALSAPQGLGFLHHRPGELDDKTISEIIDRDRGGRIVASMDYVHGRSCKFTVIRGGESGAHDDRLFLRPTWYDHSNEQLEKLLTSIGVDDADTKIAAAAKAQEEENAKWARENPLP